MKDERWTHEPIIECRPDARLAHKIRGPNGRDMGVIYSEVVAKGIIADHNACLGIEDPETTVRGLVEALRDSLLPEALLDALDLAGLGNITARLLRQEERIAAILAKCKEPTE